MHTDWMDPYRDGQSLIHRLDPRIKLAFTVGFILAVNLTPVQAWPILIGFLALVLVLNGLARLPLRHVLKRAGLAVPFALLAGAALPFMSKGHSIWSVSVIGINLSVTDTGLWQFAGVIVRSWLSLLMALTLAVTTRFQDIIVAMRGLGIPSLLAAIISLMYRYMFVLVDEAQRLMRAREARSAEPGTPSARGRHSGGGSLLWRAQVTGSMIGTLFLRTYERSERIYQAMLARGYQGELLSLHRAALSRRDIATAGMGLALLTALVAMGNVCW